VARPSARPSIGDASPRTAATRQRQIAALKSATTQTGGGRDAGRYRLASPTGAGAWINCRRSRDVTVSAAAAAAAAATFDIFHSATETHHARRPAPHV